MLTLAEHSSGSGHKEGEDGRDTRVSGVLSESRKCISNVITITACLIRKKKKIKKNKKKEERNVACTDVIQNGPFSLYANFCMSICCAISSGSGSSSQIFAFMGC